MHVALCNQDWRKEERVEQKCPLLSESLEDVFFERKLMLKLHVGSEENG
jgi:hypothetical protein